MKLQKRSAWDYEKVVGSDSIEDLEFLASKLSDRTIRHINSTYTGGGVAEILESLIPLIKGLGIETEWDVIKGDDEFFSVTKTFHNALHGRAEDAICGLPVQNLYSIGEDLNKLIDALKKRKKMFEVYMRWSRVNMEEMELDGDFVFVHDPQPAALINEKSGGKWIWRCHIDVSRPDPVVWGFLREYVSKYDASVFSTPSFARPDLDIRQFLVSPSIDPLSDKNKELPEGKIEGVLDKYEISSEKPIITQVSRFDKLKDLPGVIDAYRLVKKRVDCQLILAGGAAADDPEGMAVYRDVQKKAEGDEDIHILLLPPHSDIELNALQRASSVILQKSLKEGFGLAVAEGLWKGRPVIGGAVGGIPLQVLNGITGYLVHSVEGTAFRIRTLLREPELARKMGERGREHVRQNFLITRHLKDYLLIMLGIERKGAVIRL